MSTSPQKQQASSLDDQSLDAIRVGRKILTREADKIRSWMVKSEFLLEQKDKIINEGTQTIGQLRKALTDAQSQNDVISIRFQEEQAKKVEILQKIEATREVCELLKQKVSEYEENIHNYESDKTVVEQECNKRMELQSEFCERFSKLHATMDQDRVILKRHLILEQEHRQKWLDCQTYRLDTVRESVQKAIENCGNNSEIIASQLEKFESAYQLIASMAKMSGGMKGKYLKLAEESERNAAELKKLDEKHCALTEAMIKTQPELSSLKNDLRETRDELHNMSVSYQEMQHCILTQMNKIQAEIEHYNEELLTVSRNSIELEEKITTYAVLIDRLQNENNTIIQGKVLLEMKVESKIKENKEQVETLKNELQSALTREINFLAELDFTKQEQHSMYVAKLRVEKLLGDKELEISKLNDDVSTLGRQLEFVERKYEEELELLRQEVEEVQQDKANLNEQGKHAVSEMKSKLENAERSIAKLTEVIAVQKEELMQNSEEGKKQSAFTSELIEKLNKQETEFVEKLSEKESGFKALVTKLEEDIKEGRKEVSVQEKNFKDQLKRLEKEYKEKLKEQEKECREKLRAKSEEIRERLINSEKEMEHKIKGQKDNITKKLKEANEKRYQSEPVKRVEKKRKKEAESKRARLISVSTANSVQSEPMETATDNQTNTSMEITDMPTQPTTTLSSQSVSSNGFPNSPVEAQVPQQSSNPSSPAVSLFDKQKPAGNAMKAVSISAIAEEMDVPGEPSIASSSTDLVCLTMDDVENHDPEKYLRTPMFVKCNLKLTKSIPNTPLARKIGVRPVQTPAPVTPKTPSVLTSCTPRPALPVRKISRPCTPMARQYTSLHKPEYAFSEDCQKRLTPAPKPCKDPSKYLFSQKRAKIAVRKEIGCGDVPSINIRTGKKKVQPDKKTAINTEKQKYLALSWFDDEF